MNGAAEHPAAWTVPVPLRDAVAGIAHLMATIATLARLFLLALAAMRWLGFFAMRTHRHN